MGLCLFLSNILYVLYICFALIFNANSIIGPKMIKFEDTVVKKGN